MAAVNRSSVRDVILFSLVIFVFFAAVCAFICCDLDKNTVSDSGHSAIVSFGDDPTSIDKPTDDLTVFIYNANSQQYNPVGFDSETMTILNDIHTNADTYDVTVSLKDPVNTEWSDHTTDSIHFSFVINKFTITEITSSFSPVYDGNVQKPTFTDLSYTGIGNRPADSSVTISLKEGYDGITATEQKVDVTVSEDLNFSDYSCTITYEIAKADYDMSGVSMATSLKTYNATDQIIEVTGTLPTGYDGIQVTVAYSGSAKYVSDGNVKITANFSTTSVNYNTPSPMSAYLQITKRDVIVTGITAEDKIYDGTTDVVLDTSEAILAGKISGDDLGITVTGHFATKRYSESVKTVKIDSITLVGSVADNYQIMKSGTMDSTKAYISQRVVTITGVSTPDKEYDGTASADATVGALSWMYPTDDIVIVAGSAAFSDKNVGTSKTVTYTGYSLTGDDANNYLLSAQPETDTADITVHYVTISSIHVDNKYYNGNDIASAKGGKLSWKYKYDNVSIVPGTAKFSDANVGVNKPVTFTDYSLSGLDADNYALSADPESATATILPKEITISNGPEPIIKEYDGTDVIDQLVLGEHYIVSGVIGTDVVNIESFNSVFDSKTVAAKYVTLTEIELDNANYFSLGATLDAEIVPANVKILGVSAEDKVYNGNDNAIIIGEPYLDWLYSGDDVQINIGTAKFSDAIVGEDKTVTFTGFYLSGSSVENYYLTQQPDDVKADITKKSIKWVNTNSYIVKVYDGTDSGVELTLNKNYGFDGVVGNDAVDLLDRTNHFDKNDTTASKIILTDISLDNINYSLSNDNIVAYIAAKKVNIVNGPEQITKEYDGTTNGIELILGTHYVVTDTVGSDQVDLVNKTCYFDKADVKATKVILSSLLLDNINYQLVSATLAASIVPKKVTAENTETQIEKQYDGTKALTTLVKGVNYIFVGEIEGDNLDFNSSIAYYDKVDVHATTVTVKDTAVNNENYVVSSAILNARIIPHDVIILGVSAEDKVYDGNDTAVITGTPMLSWRMSGDDVHIQSGTAKFDSKDTGKRTVTFEGFSLFGTDSENYNLTDQPAPVTAYITTTVTFDSFPVVFIGALVAIVLAFLIMAFVTKK